MIGIAVVSVPLVVTFAVPVAMVIITVVAIVFLVAVPISLSHRRGRRQCE